MDDYLNNYMKKRTGGVWPAVIVIAIVLLIALVNWIFDLGWL